MASNEDVSREAAAAAERAAQKLADDQRVTEEQLRLAKLQVKEMREAEGK